MVVAVRRVRSSEDATWVVPALGTITATNGIGHAVGSVVTRSYSPGLVSGLTAWAPLGLIALTRARRQLPHSVFRRGIAAGALIQAGIVVLVLPLSRKT